MKFGIKIQSMKKRLFNFTDIYVAVLHRDVEHSALAVAILAASVDAFRVEEAPERDVTVG